jgi:hypothetical protein
VETAKTQAAATIEIAPQLVLAAAAIAAQPALAQRLPQLLQQVLRSQHQQQQWRQRHLYHQQLQQQQPNCSWSAAVSACVGRKGHRVSQHSAAVHRLAEQWWTRFNRLQEARVEAAGWACKLAWAGQRAAIAKYRRQFCMSMLYAFVVEGTAVDTASQQADIPAEVQAAVGSTADKIPVQSPVGHPVDLK